MKNALMAVLLAAPAMASCTDRDLYYYPESASGLYKKSAEQTRSVCVDRKEILHWSGSPKDRTRIGYLKRFETLPAGSIATRESYQIYNAVGDKSIGFITAEGVFYRFDEQGRLGQRVGEYPILPTGIKVFFGLPMRDNIVLEDIDPYK